MNCANHPDRERVAFCQNCGKPLCTECSRVIGQAVFCEPCLAARLAGGSASSGATQQGSDGRWGNAAYSAPPSAAVGGDSIPPPAAPGEPNPGLAALLGFIPGVGAFYNGQYAKGVIHLIVFAVLISLADEHGIFGLFIAGWVFYQVLEAHHTARARRDGTPLPNPFGLNDLGERLGFGKAWPGPSNGPGIGYPPVPPPAAQTGYGPQPGAPFSPAGSAASYTSASSAASNWGAPAEAYTSVPPPAAPYGTSPENPYGPAMPVAPFPTADAGRSLPTGAFVLIGLGAFFLIANTGRFQGVNIQWFIPLILIGLGVWTFVRRMASTGASFGDDGSPMYRFRLYSALRSSLWLLLVGLLFFLDLTHVLPWSRSWPLFIVVAGVIGLLKRSAYAGFTSAPLATAPYRAASPDQGPTQTTMAPNPIVPTDMANPQDRS